MKTKWSALKKFLNLLTGNTPKKIDSDYKDSAFNTDKSEFDNGFVFHVSYKHACEAGLLPSEAWHVAKGAQVAWHNMEIKTTEDLYFYVKKKTDQALKKGNK